MEGDIRDNRFEADNVVLDTSDQGAFPNGKATLVLRPEDVFLRRPENLIQNYQRLADGIVEEVNFIGAFERVNVRLQTPDKKPIIVTRPKTETAAFPLFPGKSVTVGVVRFRILSHSKELPRENAASTATGK